MEQYQTKVTESLMLIDQYEVCLSCMNILEETQANDSFQYYMPGADNGSDMEGLEQVGMPGVS